ncbi:MAG: tetratricopeptide repeat protein [Anaerolineae bacterium]
MGDLLGESQEALPTGTVTLMFTDIEGSTQLLERLPGDYARLLADHQQILCTAFEAFNGRIVDTQGDSFFVVFLRSADAVNAAVAAQRGLSAFQWPQGASVRVRMGLHTGEPAVAGGRYVGIDVHRAARLGAAGHGGQVLLSQSTRAWVEGALPEGVSLRDLGEHRLKDLSVPQRIFQLVIAGLPADFAPLKTLEPFKHNLPSPLTSFVGREKEMGEIQRLVSDSARLVTLTGPGGTGKTRLAMEVGRALVTAYNVGWVDLSSLADAARVPDAVAKVLGVPEQQNKSLTATLVEFLRAQELLLVIDNCEHLIDPCATLIETLLSQCEKVRVLATSRQVLGIVGESVYRVPPLQVPMGRAAIPVSDLAQYEAVRLLSERARSQAAGFQVTEQNAPHVIRICQRLDGIPLAIELAAARMSSLSAEEIANRLDNRFRLLTGGNRAALPRHQTLRATVEWSYELLSEPERLLFQRLEVFAGGWRLAAAEAICGDDRLPGERILECLSHLVEKSLVSVDPAAPGARYRFLETIREYARDKLNDSGEANLVRARHLDFFLALVEEADPHLSDAAQVTWFDRLEAEHDNLRAAIDWAAGYGTITAALRLAGALTYFWEVRGHYSEGRECLMRILGRPDASERTAVRAKALTAAGQMIWAGGDQATARPLLEQALAIGREVGDKRQMAWTLNYLANALLSDHDYAAARRYLEEGVAIQRELENAHGVGTALMFLGDVALQEDDYAAAQALYEESIGLLRKEGDLVALAYPWRRLGQIQLQRGEPLGAFARLKESLSLNQQVGDYRGSIGCLAALAEAVAAQGNTLRAAQLLAAVEGLQESMRTHLWPLDRERYNRIVTALGARLAPDRLSQAWAEGRVLTLTQAIELALRDKDDKGFEIDGQSHERV